MFPARCGEVSTRSLTLLCPPRRRPKLIARVDKLKEDMATKAKNPNSPPPMPFPAAQDALHQVGQWLRIPLRKEWRDVTTKPEEVVRQKFIRILVEHCGYDLAQIDQERRTLHGHKSPRADIVVWQSSTDRQPSRRRCSTSSEQGTLIVEHTEQRRPNFLGIPPDS